MASLTQPPVADKTAQPEAGLLTKPLIDYYLVLISAGLLAALGVMMVLSSSTPYAGGNPNISSPYEFAIRQVIFLAAGIPMAFLFSRLRLDILAKLGWVGWGLAVLLLGAVALTTSRSIGERGNTNWLSINSQLAIQPSEFAKLALVVWAAAIMAAKVRKLDQPKHLIVPFIPGAALIITLVLAGRDLGTAMVMALIVVALLWFVGTPMRIMGILTGLGMVVIGGLALGNANRLSRIMVWLNPASDPDRASQPVSALYAMASGGWWGVGLGAGKQKWGGLKDGAHTDFIFAVIGEELGLVGVLLVLGLFSVIGLIGLRIALRSDEPFSRILAAGLSAWFVVQAGINILVVLNLLPVLGIPLPFMSYGGSALVANLIALGVLLACARNEPEARKALRAARKKTSPRVTRVVDANSRR